jgi:hypothetical protein
MAQVLFSAFAPFLPFLLPLLALGLLVDPAFGFTFAAAAVRALALELFAAFPAHFAGSVAGFKLPLFADPVPTNMIPHRISRRRRLLKQSALALAAGVGVFLLTLPALLSLAQCLFTPFSAPFALRAAVAGCAVVVLAAAAVGCLAAYFVLSNEDHNWWAAAARAPAAAAIFVFAFFCVVARLKAPSDSADVVLVLVVGVVAAWTVATIAAGSGFVFSWENLEITTFAGSRLGEGFVAPSSFVAFVSERASVP